VTVLTLVIVHVASVIITV